MFKIYLTYSSNTDETLGESSNNSILNKTALRFFVRVDIKVSCSEAEFCEEDETLAIL